MCNNYHFGQLPLLLVPPMFVVLFHSFSDISVSLFSPQFLYYSNNKWIIDCTLHAWLEFSKFSMQVRAWLRCAVATIDTNSCSTTSIVVSQTLSFNIFLPFLTSIELHQEMNTSSMSAVIKQMSNHETQLPMKCSSQPIHVQIDKLHPSCLQHQYRLSNY